MGLSGSIYRQRRNQIVAIILFVGTIAFLAFTDLRAAQENAAPAPCDPPKGYVAVKDAEALQRKIDAAGGEITEKYWVCEQ